jgi:predicted MFS family arabinose efflux permease
LGINIISFILSNFLIYPIKHIRAFSPKENEGIFDKISLGIRYFIDRPLMFLFIVILILPHIASISQNIVLPGYVLNHLGENSFTYGFMSMIYGIGATTISMIFVIKGDSFFRKSLLEMSFITSIIALGIIVLSKSLILSYIGIFMFGFGNSAIKIFLIAYMMKVIDKKYMGRSIAIKNIIITVLQIFTSYNIGIIMDLYGDISGYIFLETIMLSSLGLYLCLGRKLQKI